MLKKSQLKNISLDINAIEKLLSNAERHGDYVALKQYQLKLERLKNTLIETESILPTQASVALYFDGEPVYGSRGISASFAGNSLDKFQELVNKVYTYNDNGRVASRGNSLNRKASNLMITGITKGSFGFVLNEISDQIELTETSLKLTVDEVLDLIEVASLNDEEHFSAAIEGIDHRVLKSLKAFFKILDQGKSCLRIVGEHSEYKLDSNSIQLARQRTETITIEEKEDTYDLTFRGMLPEGCRFEATDADGNLISGTIIKKAVEKMLSKRTNDIIRVKMEVKKVKPLNKPEKLLYRITQLCE
ncbi:hypothetical protein AADF95_004533 [Vibrio alginolyticus]